MEVTGTFKQLKVQLVEESFDPGRIRDPLYILDDKEKSYIPLTDQIHSSITSGDIKLWADVFPNRLSDDSGIEFFYNELPTQGTNLKLRVFCKKYGDIHTIVKSSSWEPGV